MSANEKMLQNYFYEKKVIPLHETHDLVSSEGSRGHFVNTEFLHLQKGVVNL